MSKASVVKLHSFADLGKVKEQLTTKTVEQKKADAVQLSQEFSQHTRRRKVIEVDVEIKGTTKVTTTRKTVYSKRQVRVPEHAKSNPNWPEANPNGNQSPGFIKPRATAQQSTLRSHYSPEADFERRDEIRMPSRFQAQDTGDGGYFKIMDRTTGRMSCSIPPELKGTVQRLFSDLFGKRES